MAGLSPIVPDDEKVQESPLKTVVCKQIASLIQALRLHYAIRILAIGLYAAFFVIAGMLDVSPGIQAITFLILFIPLFIGGMVWALRVRSRSREARRVVSAQAFAGLVEKQEPYMRGGQHFAGRYEGRNFDAYLTQIRDFNQLVKGGVYSGENLDIFVDTTVMVRLGVGLADRTADAVNKRLQSGTFLLDELEERGVSVRGTDKKWSERAVRNHVIADEFVYLVKENPLGALRSLAILPGQIKLSMRRINISSITNEQIRELLASLTRLAQAVEALPSPTVVENMTAVEKMLRGDRRNLKKLAYLILAILLGVSSIPVIAAIYFFFHLALK